MKIKKKRIVLFIMVVICLSVFTGCDKKYDNIAANKISFDYKKNQNHIDKKNKTKFKYKFGVFLNYSGNLKKLSDYETIVIDAQYIKKKDITAFKAKGHKVYSYINVGSLENFRTYYKKYKKLMLGKYEHWDEECWIDVSSKTWQDFILKDLSVKLMKKSIDGFFVDNCDVYYVYPKKKIFKGLSVILEGLKAKGKAVIINSGNDFLDKYCSEGGNWRKIITGINQECVFSSINWDDNTFGEAKKEDQKFFRNYIEKYGKKGVKIYLIEYTKDQKLIKKIKNYCKKKKFNYYIAGRLELDA